MPLLLLLLLACTVGCGVGLFAWRYPRVTSPLTTPRLDAASKVGEGLALAVVLVFIVGAGLLLGVLAYLVRSNSHLIGIDNSVANWGDRHATALSTDGLNVVTQLGATYVVISLCVVLAVVETYRTRSVWIVPFILVVVAGEGLTTGTIKQLVGRVRPAFDPLTATLGPSFPSGHSATAAAFFAAAALLLGRRRSRRTRAVLTGLAAGIAVAVAASRVLLDVHWLSDVIAGLALGWAWFAACGIAFGGRLLSFGATVETAPRVADASPGPP